MENYIVRIYQRKKDDPYAYIGVVEEAGIEGKKAFTNVEELWEILKPKKKQKQAKRDREFNGYKNRSEKRFDIKGGGR
jgi:hypothetical protein